LVLPYITSPRLPWHKALLQLWAFHYSQGYFKKFAAPYLGLADFLKPSFFSFLKYYLSTFYVDKLFLLILISASYFVY